MRRGIGCLLVLAIGALLPAYAPTTQPALTEQSKQSYRLVVDAFEKQKYTMAMARLDGLLMPQPVSVGIDMDTIPKDAKEFVEGVRQGIAIWTQALPDSPFRYSAFGENPMLRIQFVDRVEGSGDVQGMINARREFAWNSREYSSKISGTILIVRHTNGRYLTRDEIAEVTGHELGHLLGLDDVEGTRGLMGPFVAGQPRPFVEQDELDVVTAFRRTMRERSAQILQQQSTMVRRQDARSLGTTEE
ncbi:MAG: hypothetical protein M9921_05815 [Fimbriimonadaceae bacterium]|nr:hypothetical protein [Fimbriimonadaceae bacterium]